MMVLPLAIGGVCIITSIVGTFFVKLRRRQSIMGALYKGLIVTGVLSLVGIAVRHRLGLHRLRHAARQRRATYTGTTLFICGIVGLVVTGLIIWITEYYTGTDYPSGEVDRGGLGHRSRHQRHPGSRDLDGSRPRCPRSSSSPASWSPITSPACSASRSR